MTLAREVDSIGRYIRWLTPERPAQLGHNGPPVDDSVRFTDIGNTDTFIKEYGEEVLHCRELGWLAWDGSRWEPDSSPKVVCRAEETVRKLATEARQIGRFSIGSKSSVTSIVELAKNRLDVTHNTFDQDDWLLNCPYGTLNLKTGELLRHNRSDRITKITTVPFSSGATCPRFLTFLDEIMEGNTEMITFLQRALGYSLSGSTREHCLFIPYGPGRNSKSALHHCLCEDYW